MKNNSFRYLHLFLVVCSVGLIFSTFRSDEERPNGRRPTSLPKPQKHFHRHPQRQHQQSLRAIPVVPFPQDRGPASVRTYERVSLDNAVKARSDMKMAPGYVFAQNIGAIPLKDWKPGMPKLIHDNGIYGFFEKSPGDNSAIPTAYNVTTGQLNVISSVIHVKGVDEATRQQLIGSGFQEYYYFKNIQRLSITTSPGQVVSAYDRLSKLGLNAKLEVIREKPKAH